MKETGFTLLEILLVITLVGLLSMVLVPKIFEKKVVSSGDKVELFFNNLFQEAYKIANKEQQPIILRLTKGSDNILLWNKKYKKIPEYLIINQIEINGQNITGLHAYLSIYPNKTVDYVKLYFSNGKIYSTNPILMELLLEK